MFQYHYKAAIQSWLKYYTERDMTSVGSAPELFAHPRATDDNTTAEHLACIKNAIDKVMIENGLEDEWAEYQTELIVVLAALDQCKEIEDAAESQE